MKIIKNYAVYLEQLVDVVEEYRMFCGAPSCPKDTRAFFQARLDQNDAVTFIALDEADDRVMGFVNLYPSFSTLALKRLWILNDLGVSSACRGKGVAKALINGVLAFAGETDAVRVELKTQTANINAQKLYQSVGFEIDDGNVYYQVPAN